MGLAFLTYLRILAKLQLAKVNLLRKLTSKNPVMIVGITGSVGKTSTMLATVAALKDSFKVKYSEKANSESGIPLNILGLTMKDYSIFDWLRVAVFLPLMLFLNWQDYDVYVVEMGVDEPTEPKNMSYLLKIIRPQIGVFIGVTSVHSQQFEKLFTSEVKTGTPPRCVSLEKVLNAIADEKAKLIASLPKDGFAVLNLNDRFVTERKGLTRAKTIGVGTDKDIHVEKVSSSKEGTSIKYSFSGTTIHERSSMYSQKGIVLPEAYAINFGLAIGVAAALGIMPQKAIDGIKRNFKMPPGRCSLIKGIKNILIIDSSYNSSPKASLAILDLLDDLGRKTRRKKIAVLGDMRELGNQSKIEHENLAEATVKIADEIVLVGPEMEKHFLPKALKAGWKPGCYREEHASLDSSLSFRMTSNKAKKLVHIFKNACFAAEFLKKHLQGGELLLVKGSQNTIFLEIVVETLMADKSKSDELLCRRGTYWEGKRKMVKK